MLRKIISLLMLVFTLVSCQFTETMVIDDKGHGRMSLAIDLSDMMEMMGGMGEDSTMVKTDTIITFKSILEEKKDSIAQLPKEEQKRLKKMEGYIIHFTIDPDHKKSVIEIVTDFNRHVLLSIAGSVTSVDSVTKESPESTVKSASASAETKVVLSKVISAVSNLGWSASACWSALTEAVTTAV